MKARSRCPESRVCQRSSRTPSSACSVPKVSATPGWSIGSTPSWRASSVSMTVRRTSPRRWKAVQVMVVSSLWEPALRFAHLWYVPRVCKKLMVCKVVAGGAQAASRATPASALPAAAPSRLRRVLASSLALDHDTGGLDDRGRGDTGRQLHLVGRLAAHQRHDAVVAAGELDLGHDAVALDGHHDAGQPVARARGPVRARQRHEEACELGRR